MFKIAIHQNLTQSPHHALVTALKESDFRFENAQELEVFALQQAESGLHLAIKMPKTPKIPAAWSLYKLQQVFAAISQEVSKLRLKTVAIDFDDFGSNHRLTLSVLVNAFGERFYRYDAFKSKKSKPTFFEQIIIKTALQEQEVQQTLAIEHGKNLAKDLANCPPNVCNPTFLAQKAQSLANDHPFNVKVLSEKQMQEQGFGSLLAVAQGSKQEPCLIVFEYFGAADKKQAPFALVGKGVTFDTGGISLKPPANMDEMKYDMCGAASVFGTLLAISAMKLPINVVGVIPAVENMPSDRATRPGDIVTSLSGKTIEILNTDAEGRLILCDALTYVQNEYKPQQVVDIATLTGAVIIALGHEYAGVMGNNQALVDQLLDASQSSAEPLWQLPLGEHYTSLMKSPFADIANIQSDRSAGTITAGSFLEAFCEKTHWAHLDIAGVAWKSGAQKGATGRPVALLSNWLIAKTKTETK